MLCGAVESAMPDRAVVTFTLPADDADLVLAAISTQMGYERKVVEHRENYTPLYAEDAKRRLERYRAIADQVREAERQTDGGG
jgi:hypothetical protein